MTISFLELMPKQPTETVRLDTQDGPADVELRGVSFAALADIAKRYPAFQRFIEGGTGSVVDSGEALPSLVAAGLGHPGDKTYEEKASSFPTADIVKMALTVVRLTFPPATAVPLPPTSEAAPPLVDGADGAVMMRQTSLGPSSN
jgi:hypothetical protein